MASEFISPFPPGFAISTSRLQITPFDPDNQKHCEFLVQLWNTDDFINSCGRTSITTPEKASNFIRHRVLQQYSLNQHGWFLVSLKDAEGDNGTGTLSPIGLVSLLKGSPPDPHYTAPDIGFTILSEYTGNGYATEAAKGLLAWAHASLGIEAVFGFCDASNLRSGRVLQKIGMRFKGVAELKVFGGNSSALYVLPGMSDDLAVYGLTELNSQ